MQLFETCAVNMSGGTEIPTTTKKRVNSWTPKPALTGQFWDRFWDKTTIVTYQKKIMNIPWFFYGKLVFNSIKIDKLGFQWFKNLFINEFTSKGKN